MKHLKVGNGAFWRYDLKPFLYGTIVEVKKDKSYPGKGWVAIEGYGIGTWFKPVFCLPKAKGAQVASLIDEAEARYSKANRETYAKRTREIQDIIPKGVSVWRARSLLSPTKTKTKSFHEY